LPISAEKKDSEIEKQIAFNTFDEATKARVASAKKLL